MRVAEMVEPIGIGRCKRAVDLKDGDAENEDEREHVEQNPEFDNDAVFKKNPRTEKRYSVLQDQKPEHLRNRLLARTDQEKSRPHRGEGDRNRQFRGDRFMNVQKPPDGESADGHQKDDEARQLERHYRFKFTAGTRLAHRIVKKHRQRDTLHERIDESDYPYPRPRTAARLPIPEKDRQNAHRPALDGDEAYRGFEPARARKRQIGDQEQSQNYFGKRQHGFQIQLKNRRTPERRARQRVRRPLWSAGISKSAYAP